MDYAVVNGVELAYEDVGQGDAILFIHGGQGTADAFHPLLSEPALAGFRKILYHQRGNGQSGELDGPRGNYNEALDARGLLDHFNVEAAHVVAHSWGSGIAGTLAVLEPRRVLSLVVLEPGALNMPQTQDLNAENDLGERYRELGQQTRVRRERGRSERESRTIEETIDDAIVNLGEGVDGTRRLNESFPDLREQMRRFFERQQVQAGTQSASRALIRDWPPVLADFHNLALPVLWVWSARPSLQVQRASFYWRALLPDMEEETVPGVGHALQMLKPTEIAELISDFYAEHGLE